MFTCLNLEKYLQEQDATFLDFSGQLKALVIRLELWEAELDEGESYMFESLVDREDPGNTPKQLATLIQEHLYTRGTSYGLISPSSESFTSGFS